MKAYGHLTYEERDRIALLRAEGLCPSQIAQEIGRPSCTVGRELKRNSNGDGGYRPVSAEGRYLARRQRERLLDANPDRAALVSPLLSSGWTPEQISCCLLSCPQNLPSLVYRTSLDRRPHGVFSCQTQLH